MSSTAPRMKQPALLTSTSIPLKKLSASAIVDLIDSVGAVTSRGIHFPRPFGAEVMLSTRSGVRDGFRDVAMTLWPFARARRARERPKPEEQPVISQVEGVEGMYLDAISFEQELDN